MLIIALFALGFLISALIVKILVLRKVAQWREEEIDYCRKVADQAMLVLRGYRTDEKGATPSLGEYTIDELLDNGDEE